ncbi:hypothetical protein UCRNP2_3151 [Neofusicoccum parvum UCRNP2]|uniref:Uncharacterized protein n=1 Tax=Botryosphaeria parva (strain UCR-NP2) TaxID=1287680 RepID=R1ER89_BOTPV|nr:hypothetical protein UCRNP2_3151 [Neofusicoccum parvum UCRNP2]
MSVCPATNPVNGLTPHTLPVTNAYYCCHCNYGPMLYELHPACIMCSTPACGNCSGTTIHAQPEYLRQSPQDQLDPHPGDPYGAALGFDTRTDTSMMLRYLHEEPTVSERLSSGTARPSLVDATDELDRMMQQYGYQRGDSEAKL